ncbi:fatty-acid amide hydrolase 2-B-like isoform X1 [Plodia interpunctella]|uniref:fatty-acid amide hydrolase 2-B-like isoform X1 n=2 Tax=Plodia interpunctella TaxID=58824 RepID=UPI0023682089|nr:fatty-acid amide hydrolase 2-B-like isoform X1 [Plodia interpunctella]
MFNIFLNIFNSCFNASVNVFTRAVLIIISASIYQAFVLIEVFLNSYNLLYPPYLSKPVVKIKNVGSTVVGFAVKIIAFETAMMNGFMRRFLRFLVSLLAILVFPLSFFLNIKRTRKCPPPKNPILFKSATTLAMMIRNKQITSEELVTAYIERCKEVNPYLNAVVEPRYEQALREARSIDKMIASTDRNPEDLAKEYPLLGLPMTVKESIAVEGMSNDCGTVYPYRNPAKTDADIIKLARAAGAIPIAVTNTPQLCMNWETYNNVTGLTMNPYDQKRTTGGSSGGEAALIASAASVIGVGSDIAGSLRLPPMFNGIFGHKPTPRLLSVEGHVPSCLDPDFEEYFALGPLARYAEDLSLLLKVLKKPGSPDVPFDKPVDITKLKFYYMEGDGSNVSNPIGSDVRNALEKAKGYIKNTYNIEVQPLKINNVEHMWEIGIRVLMNIRHVQNIYTDPENREKLIPMWPEVIKRMFGVSNHNFLCVAYGPLQKFFDALPKNYYKNLLTMFDQIKSEFEKALSDDAVLLFPTFPYPAHKHYRIYYKFLNCGYLTIFNALGLPVTACPIELTPKGLPVGIQIVANKCNDHLTIAVAKEFEKAFGGWTPPNRDLLNVKTA